MNLLNRSPPSPTSKKRGVMGISSTISNAKSSSSSRSLNWRPRTADEIVRKKNRRVVSQHLKRIGKAAGRELSLNQDGVCCFSFKRFVVVVEVPEDRSEICVFYTKVCHMGRPQDNLEEVERFVSSFNHKQAASSSGSSNELHADLSSASDSTCPCVDPAGSHGMRLELKGDEVNLCLSVPIQGLSFQDTADHLEQFVKTAVAANRKLLKIKSIPKPEPPPEAAPTVESSLPLPMDKAPSSPIGRLRMWSIDSQSSVSNLPQCTLFSLFTSNTNLGGSSSPSSS